MDANTQNTAQLGIGDIEIAIPVRFQAGHTLTPAEAAVLQRAYEKGFKNAAEAAQRQRNKYYTADEYVEQWLTYEPGTPRTSESTLEKMRLEAGLRTLAELIDEHNSAVKSGERGIFKKFASKLMRLPGGKGSREVKDAWVNAILTTPAHDERVARHLDAIKAEKGQRKEAAADEGVVTIGINDLG